MSEYPLQYNDTLNSLLVGRKVYEPVTITREMILELNQEQLEVFYKVINGSLTTINFDGEIPEKGTETEEDFE